MVEKNPHNLRQELRVASELARQAGAAALHHYHRDVEVEYKDARATDPVTQADKDANRIIVQGLLAAFPDDGILAEESPASEQRLSRPRLWCVDPVDGTRDFLEHNGQFVVMIGLAIQGSARLGVVYQPTEDLLLAGIVGDIAWYEQGGNRTPLVVSTQADPHHAAMVVSRSHRSKTVSQVAAQLGVATETPLGSVGLKVARIAEGNADIYISVSDRTQEWDACAPDAILHAAGGKMTDICGSPLIYNKPQHNTPRGMLATNGALHGECVSALRATAQTLY